MATGVGQKQISQPQLNWSTPKTLIRCRNGGRISHTNRLIANFLLKFSFFVAMATGVGLAQISLAQLNSPTPITPY